ncbi:MAG TPA: hypothetical protein VFY71_01975 [Planctomycetota bacterium]|nr:hypothetical protein [Planctomycetota bacterium]
MISRRLLPLLPLMACLASHAQGGDWTDPAPVPGSFILSSLTAQVAAPPDGHAFVRLDIAKDGAETVVVRLLGLPAGPYDVWVGFPPGSPAGTVEVGADGLGELSLEPPQFGGFFNWFLDKEKVDVRQGATVLFSDVLDSPGGGVLLDDAVSCANGARFIAVGADLDARGLLNYHSGMGWQDVRVRLERLAPGPYVIEIGGHPDLLVDVVANGKGSLRQHIPEKAGAGTVTVYPLGQLVRVLDHEGALVLEAQMPWDPFEAWSQSAQKQSFTSTGVGAADGLRVDFVRNDYVGDGGLQKGWLQWQRDAPGAATLTVRIPDQDFSVLDPYGIYVQDDLVGEFGTTSDWVDGGLKKTVSVGPEVDLRGRRVELRHDDQAGLALIFPVSVPAGVRSYRRELRKPKHMHLSLLNPGTDLDATGVLDWRRTAGDIERLRLIASDMPAGPYDIAIDGKVVATAALVVEEAGGSATVQFSTLDDGSLPLNFAVDGALEIRAASSGAVYLQQSLAH